MSPGATRGWPGRPSSEPEVGRAGLQASRGSHPACPSCLPRCVPAPAPAWGVGWGQGARGGRNGHRSMRQKHREAAELAPQVVRERGGCPCQDLPLLGRRNCRPETTNYTGHLCPEAQEPNPAGLSPSSPAAGLAARGINSAPPGPTQPSAAGWHVCRNTAERVDPKHRATWIPPTSPVERPEEPGRHLLSLAERPQHPVSASARPWAKPRAVLPLNTHSEQ